MKIKETFSKEKILKLYHNLLKENSTTQDNMQRFKEKHFKKLFKKR
jgi:hypothetical protein